MENYTLLNHKMDGTGQNMVSKRTNGVIGYNMLIMLDLTLPYYHYQKKTELNSMKPELLNFSKI